MLKTSELQSQIALNSKIISEKELCKKGKKERAEIYNDFLKMYPKRKHADWKLKLANEKSDYKMLKRQIAQYAKLQRALKREMAYKINYNRMVKEIEVTTRKAQIEGWEVVIVGGYNE